VVQRGLGGDLPPQRQVQTIRAWTERVATEKETWRRGPMKMKKRNQAIRAGNCSGVDDYFSLDLLGFRKSQSKIS
jgi:hypothetical protein